MRIDRKLNLVQPIETETGTIHLHSMPLSREVWENYFLILSKTYSQLFAQGLHTISGPAVAGLMLRHIATQDGVWEGDAGVKNGLMPEIRRLTNIVLPTGAGWGTLPYEEALRRKMIDDDTATEAEGAIVFFICASAVLRGPKAKAKLGILLGMTESQWGAQYTSSDATAFGASLPTSTPVESSGEKRPASSVPY